MENYSDIYQFVKSQEENYKLPIDIMGWRWNMPEHIKTSFYYKNGRLLTGNTDDKPVKNITRPILNLQYRTEDIDVKDILLYVEDPERYHLSFLVKKYHDDVFVIENNVDDFLDKLNESRIDYGGGLSKKGSGLPEVVPLESIAFCDQTDILSGPIGIRHYYSPDQLKEMEKKGWGDKKNGATVTVDELITLCQSEKQSVDGQISETPGKYVEIYEVHGVFKNKWLKDTDDEGYSRQLHIISYYHGANDEKIGVTLFKGKEEEQVFKMVIRDPIYGRALGFGGAEELFEPQVWVNYDQIRMKELLDAASKVILQTDDDAIAARHPSGLKGMDNLEILTVADGKRVGQLDTFPRNITLFERSISEWEAHAQQMGAANDSIMGVSPTSGTPFKLQELVTEESRGLHTFRRGKFAKHVEEIYRDWTIPSIVEKISKGVKFFFNLTLEEMQLVSENIVNKAANNLIKERILNGEMISDEEVEALKMQTRDSFMKDNKKFIEILKGELKDAPIKVKINIAGKQKNMASQVDKLVNIFRQIASAPQILDDPRMAKIFNQILEGSGLSPIDFGYLKKKEATPELPTETPPVTSTEPLQDLSKNLQQ